MDNIINFLIEGRGEWKYRSEKAREIDKWIHHNMKRCISGQKPLKPSKSIIRDTLFQQYIKLRAKEVKDWNKRQQDAMTTPASS
ncbi:hypothetical protein Goari_019621 [Gossypium aridum]|uniref:Uncharacterized protein n=1 Tax=Gossypium aridum TaxID=34290 RepID=A0A7J8WT82_GOSAI|nr:hypothetical protein [Gossypium aridum]